jgi:DNA-binding YbaB/EbfC family protein
VKGSLSDLMKQAQQMQEKMQQAQQELANLEIEGQAGAGLVTVTMNGRFSVKRVHIDEAVLGEDKEVLEDLLAAAVNDAVKKVESQNQSAMGGLLPPGFKMPF